MSNVMNDRRLMKWRGIHASRRRYPDEEGWEPVDVPLALEFLHEAGGIRSAAAVFEARPVWPAEWMTLSSAT